MASLTKSDRTMLYSRAENLSHQAVEIDVWADNMAQTGLVKRAAAHRLIATTMREEAAECRKWADSPESD